jgi:hypothetical protein
VGGGGAGEGAASDDDDVVAHLLQLRTTKREGEGGV